RVAARAGLAPLGPDLLRPAELLQLQAHGRELRRAARSRRADPPLRHAAAARRAAVVLDQPAPLQPRRGRAAWALGRGHEAHDPARLRAQVDHPPVLRHPTLAIDRARDRGPQLVDVERLLEEELAAGLARLCSL